MEYKEQTKAYWNKSAEGYSKSIRKELEAQKKDIWTKLILDNAPKEGKLKILDIGCGPGFFSIIMSMQGHDVTGIDVTPEMVKEAKANAAAAGVSPVIKQMDVHETEFEDNTFDMVISRNVTWTLYDPEKAYAEWKRILVPGGRILAFDGNWYMQYFDEKMNDELQKGLKTYREKYNELPVRSTVFQFEDYCLELPMIGRKRPLWDRAQFWKMKMTDIVYKEDISDNFEENDVSRYIYGSTPMFSVRATKVTPEEEDENDLRLHFDGMAPLFGTEAVNNLREEMPIVSRILSQIPEGTKTVLDAGCGAGLLTAALAKKGCDVTGADHSKPMIDELKYTLEKAGAKANVLHENIKKLSLDDESMDAVILKDVLWLQFDPVKVLNECSRVLKPGGTLIIADSNRYLFDSEEEEEAFREKWYPISMENMMVIYNCGDRRSSLVDKFSEKLYLSDKKRPDWEEEYLADKGFELLSEEAVPETEDQPESFIVSFIKK